MASFFGSRNAESSVINRENTRHRASMEDVADRVSLSCKTDSHRSIRMGILFRCCLLDLTSSSSCLIFLVYDSGVPADSSTCEDLDLTCIFHTCNFGLRLWLTASRMPTVTGSCRVLSGTQPASESSQLSDFLSKLPWVLSLLVLPGISRAGSFSKVQNFDLQIYCHDAWLGPGWTAFVTN